MSKRTPQHHGQTSHTTVEVPYASLEGKDGPNGGDSGGVMPNVVEESHTRSLLKGVTWRVVATTTTVVIAYIVTGEVTAALKIGFVEFFAKVAIYYAHERIWARIRI